MSQIICSMLSYFMENIRFKVSRMFLYNKVEFSRVKRNLTITPKIIDFCFTGLMTFMEIFWTKKTVNPFLLVSVRFCFRILSFLVKSVII